MGLDDPFAALNAIPRALADTRTAVEDLREEVQRDRRMIGWLRVACTVIAVAALATIGWTAYQQTVIDGKSAAIAALAGRNRDAALTEARNAHDLCVKLNRSRTVLAGVWAKVLSGRPDGAVLLAEVKAAEPLGRCPKAPPARS